MISGPAVGGRKTVDISYVDHGCIDSAQSLIRSHSSTAASLCIYKQSRFTNYIIKEWT